MMLENSTPLFPICVPGSCVLFVTERESGAGILQLRFIVYVSLSVFFGFLIRPPSSPFYEIRGVSCLIIYFVLRLGENPRGDW